MKPVGLALPMVNAGLRLSNGTKSACTCSYQSTSPVCSAAAAVAASGMTFHSIRSKCATFPPDVQLVRFHGPAGLKVEVMGPAPEGIFPGEGSGLLTAGLIDGGSPTAGDLAELDSIAAVIIGGAAFAGGRRNVGNALVGAFTIGVIRNALNLHNVDAFYQLMAIGVVVLLAVEADVLRGYVEGRVRELQTTRHA